MTTKNRSTIERKLPITRPAFDTTDERAIVSVLRSGWVVQGPKVQEFEETFASFCGTRHAIATTSCTTALHLSLVAAGIRPGDSVLLPSFTYIASANAVEYCGAVPRFVDIDRKTFTIDPDHLIEVLDHTVMAGVKCVMPVSLFGLCADMERINEIAESFQLTVIEDAACGMGALRDGHHAGSEAMAGCFSFHPRKAISTGEGGMIITDDEAFASRLRVLRNHGATKTDLERHLSEGGSLLPDHDELGYNYRMTDLQGALGCTQMAKAKEILAGRMAAADRYNRLLQGIPKISTPHVPGDEYRHAFQSYVCLYGADRLMLEDRNRVDWSEVTWLNRERNQLMANLEAEGIAVRQGTHAVHSLGYYRKKYGLSETDFPFSYIADRLSITLPLYHDMVPEDQERVAEALRRLVPRNGNG